jgi:hypothetical protein
MMAVNLITGFGVFQRCRNLKHINMLVLSIMFVMVSACTTWQVPGEFDDNTLRSRAVSESLSGVNLSAAVLSSEDSQRMFGVNVNETGVQPVWVEIENNTDQMLWLLRAGADPDLFSSLEVAWSFHKTFGGETNDQIDDHFHAQSFENPVAPGETKSGILFTNPHRKTRLLSIDILGQGQLFPFTLFPRVPDDVSGESRVLETILKWIEVAAVEFQTTEEFREQLGQLACCATNVSGSEVGDPINVILVGGLDDVATALIRRGFRLSRMDFDDTQQVFNRRPDMVARKVGHVGAPANWLRMWVAPFRYQGKAVFLTQAGRPLGWRHKKDENQQFILNPHVDEVRNLLIHDLLYSGGLAKLAFVRGAEATRPGEERSSHDGGSYYTDGLRAVLFLVTRPQSLSDIEFLDWDSYLKQREIEAINEIENAVQ